MKLIYCYCEVFIERSSSKSFHSRGGCWFISGALDPCSGKYCGRILNNNGHFGDCGACPRGYRTNGSVCLECLSSPELYDWLYLGFMASLPVIIHWFFIDFFIKRERKRCSTNLMLLLALTFFSKELLESKNVIFIILLILCTCGYQSREGGGGR
ncbi:PREDICTED: uncharacterized protein LOC107328123 [Acropora digitifera]|uniref:uncharacterized protein LOC107328123 n=1 Tax=Acropora digitifera TaxID=70779 RepID=UPI00077A2CF0|nr:PREDICTED: uncharacterized protein LOC107328123 [Acropora digitifera]